MTKEFIPNINRNVFTNAILQLQENEGNDIAIAKTIESKLNHYKGFSFYDAFMLICNEYKIDCKCYEVNDGNLSSFKIIIRQNVHDIYAMSYQERNKDVTMDLAGTLYNMLAVEIQNEAFIKSVK
jgi:hypothetical protein